MASERAIKAAEANYGTASSSLVDNLLMDFPFSTFSDDVYIFTDPKFTVTCPNSN